MIPRVFVSSTIEDLHDLREVVRAVIEEIGYQPVMSEFGEVGYAGTHSAREACYASIASCQIAVLLIGKRYGSLGPEGISTTHNEFRVMKREGKPVICLVANDVLSFKRIYDSNKDRRTISFPGMESATHTFDFLQEVLESDTNNGFLSFSTASEARARIKQQFGHLIYDLLEKKFAPINSEIKDVLAELKTLRHELIRDKSVARDIAGFQKAMRFLLDDKNKTFVQIAESVVGSIDSAIEKLLESKSFEEFLEKNNAHLQLVSDEFLNRNATGWFANPESEISGAKRQVIKAEFGIVQNHPAAPRYGVSLFNDKTVEMNQAALDLFESRHLQLLKIYRGAGS